MSTIGLEPEPSPLLQDVVDVFEKHQMPPVIIDQFLGLIVMYEDGRICKTCGCSEYDACIDEVTGQPCGWAKPGLCTACVPAVIVPEEIKSDAT